MLQPKRTKFRKQQKGKNRGIAWRGSDVSFGDFGLQASEPARLTSRQIARLPLPAATLNDLSQTPGAHRGVRCADAVARGGAAGRRQGA